MTKIKSLLAFAALLLCGGAWATGTVDEYGFAPLVWTTFDSQDMANQGSCDHVRWGDPVNTYENLGDGNYAGKPPKYPYYGINDGTDIQWGDATSCTFAGKFRIPATDTYAALFGMGWVDGYIMVGAKTGSVKLQWKSGYEILLNLDDTRHASGSVEKTTETDLTTGYHAYAFVYDNDNHELRLYLDGECVATQSDVKMNLGGWNTRQGGLFGLPGGAAEENGPSRNDNVYCDDFRIYGDAIVPYVNPTANSIFTLPNDTDWRGRVLPSSAVEAEVTVNTAFGGNDAYKQTLNGKVATVAHVTNASGTDTVIYGLSAIGGAAGLGEITRDVYLKVSGGTASAVSAGDDSGWNQTKSVPTGNLLVNLAGDVVVNHVSGAGARGHNQSIKGNTGVVVEGNAQVKGAIVGGWISPHNNKPIVTGNTTVLIKNIQTYNENARFAPGNNTLSSYVVGGSIHQTNGGHGDVNGNSSVIINIAEGSGNFAKKIVGGSHNAGCGTAMTIGKDSTVNITAPNTVTFTDITGGGHSTGGNKANVTGNASVTLNGGTYGGTICAGGDNGANSTVGGTATLTLNGAVFTSEAKLNGGQASGTKKLVIAANTTLYPGQIEGFDEVVCENGATLNFDVSAAVAASRDAIELFASNVACEYTYTAAEGYERRMLTVGNKKIYYLFRMAAGIDPVTKYAEHFGNHPAVYSWSSGGTFHTARYQLFDIYSGSNSGSDLSGNAQYAVPGQSGNITLWNAYANNWVSPGYVLRFAGTGSSIDAQFDPLTIGGLIVESDATNFSLIGNNANKRITNIGDPNGAAETWCAIENDFTINRTGTTTLKGGVNVYIADGKTFNLNSNQTGYQLKINEGSALRLHGLGTLEVATLTATGNVTLDYTNAGHAPYITGNITIDGSTKLALPDIVEGVEYQLCSGTLSGAVDGETFVNIGGKEQKVNLTFSGNKVSYSLIAFDSTTASAINEAGETATIKLNDGATFTIDEPLTANVTIKTAGNIHVYGTKWNLTEAEKTAISGKINVVGGGSVSYWFDLVQEADNEWANVYAGPLTPNGTADAAKIEQWKRYGTVNASSAPLMSGSECWGKALFDGNLMPFITASSDGYKEVAVNGTWEGYALKVALKNNTKVTVDHLFKLQGGEKFINVDATSKLVVNDFSDGRNSTTMSYDIAAPEGVVINDNMPVNDENDCDFTYSFRGNGSMVVNGEYSLGASHKVKYVELSADEIGTGDFKTIKARKLIGFTNSTINSENVSFTSDATVKVGAEDPSASFVKPAGVSLSPADAPGTAQIIIVKSGDTVKVDGGILAPGIYVEYIGRSSTNPPFYAWKFNPGDSKTGNWTADSIWAGLFNGNPMTWNYPTYVKDADHTENVIGGHFYINAANDFQFYFDAATADSVVVNESIALTSTGYDPATKTTGTGNRSIIVNGSGNFSFNLPQITEGVNAEKVDSKGAPLEGINWGDSSIASLNVPIDASAMNGELGLRAKITQPIKLGPNSKIVFVKPAGDTAATVAYPYTITGTRGTIEVRGGGEFIVPNNMSSTVPFEITADPQEDNKGAGYIIYNVPANETVTVTAAITGAGGVKKTGAGTLVLAGDCTFTGGLLVEQGEVVIDAKPDASKLRGIVVSDGATVTIVVPQLMIETGYNADNVTGSGSVVFKKLTADGETISAVGSANIIPGTMKKWVKGIINDNYITSTPMAILYGMTLDELLTGEGYTLSAKLAGGGIGAEVDAQVVVAAAKTTIDGHDGRKIQVQVVNGNFLKVNEVFLYGDTHNGINEIWAKEIRQIYSTDLTGIGSWLENGSSADANYPYEITMLAATPRTALVKVGETPYYSFTEVAEQVQETKYTMVLQRATQLAVNLKDGVTLDVNNKDYTGIVSGSGTIKFSSIPTNTTLINSLKGNSWTGTVWFSLNGNMRNLNADNFANANSKLAFTGCDGYFSCYGGGTVVAKEVWLIDDGDTKALTISDGASNKGFLIKKLMGSGTLKDRTCNANNMGICITDASEFNGSIDVANKAGVKIGAENAGGVTAKTIEIHGAAIVDNGKTWKADSGITIKSTGSVKGSGTLNGNVTIESGATIDVGSGAMTLASGKSLTVNGTINVKSGAINELFLKTSSDPSVTADVKILDATGDVVGFGAAQYDATKGGLVIGDSATIFTISADTTVDAIAASGKTAIFVNNSAKVTGSGDITIGSITFAADKTLTIGAGVTLKFADESTYVPEGIILEAGAKISGTAVPNFAGQTIKIDGTTMAADHSYDLVEWTGFMYNNFSYGNPTIEIVGECPYTYDVVPLVHKVAIRVHSAEAAARRPLRIWCVGDSITEGYNNGASCANYRVQLAGKLTLAGYNVQMVGYHQHRSFLPTGEWAPDKWAWHSGVSAQRVWSRSATGGQNERAGYTEAIDAAMYQVGEADMVLIKLGTNDIGNSDTNDHIFEGLKEIVDRVMKGMPMAKVALATTVWYGDRDVATLSEKVRDWIKTNPYEGRLILADLNEALPKRLDSEDRALFHTDNVHPNWNGHDKMSDVWAQAVKTAYPNATEETAEPTAKAINYGAKANVDAAYTKGFVLNRKLAIPEKASYTLDGTTRAPAYEVITESSNATKVGYYLELVRPATAFRPAELKYVWVDMDIPNGKTLNDMLVPTRETLQGVVENLHVTSNMGSVTTVPANVDTVKGFLEFSPYTATAGAKNTTGYPSALWSAMDWNDTLPTSGDAGGLGCMQVHRIFGAGQENKLNNGGETIFAWNNWGEANAEGTAHADARAGEIGIGNFAQHYMTSTETSGQTDVRRRGQGSQINAAISGAGVNIDSNHVSSDYTTTRFSPWGDTMNAKAYTVRNLEIWVYDPTKLSTAMIGSESYNTLADAITAAKEGDTIEVAKDVEDETIALTKDIKLTTFKDSDVTIAAVFTGAQKLTKVGEGKITLSGANQFNAIDIQGGAVELATASALATPTITGSGRLICNGFLPTDTNHASIASLRNAATWNGTFEMKNYKRSDNANIIYFGQYGNLNSTVALNGVTATTYSGNNNHDDQVLGNLEICGNGWTTTAENYGISPMYSCNLTGSGTIDIKQGNTGTVNFVGDHSKFTGTIKITAGSKGVILSPAGSSKVTNKAANTITIAEGAVVGAGGTWVASAGVTVSGKLILEPNATVPGITGSGRVVFKGWAPDTSADNKPYPALFMSANWTGTVELCDVTQADFSYHLPRLVNAGSKLCFNGYKNYPSASDGSSGSVGNDSTLRTLEIGEKGVVMYGAFGNFGFNYAADLIGSGKITMQTSNTGNERNYVRIKGDPSAFTGSIDTTGSTYRFILSSPSYAVQSWTQSTLSPMIHVADVTATIGEGETWKAKTVLVEGTVQGSGMINASTVILGSVTASITLKDKLGSVTSAVDGYIVVVTEGEGVVTYTLQSETAPIMPSDDNKEIIVPTVPDTGVMVAPGANVVVPKGTEASKVTVKYGETLLSGENGPIAVTINATTGAIELSIKQEKEDAVRPATTAIKMALPTEDTKDKVSFTITDPIPGLFYSVSSCDTPNGTFVDSEGTQATEGTSTTTSIDMPNAKVKYFRVRVKATK